MRIGTIPYFSIKSQLPNHVRGEAQLKASINNLNPMVQIKTLSFFFFGGGEGGSFALQLNHILK